MGSLYGRLRAADDYPDELADRLKAHGQDVPGSLGERVAQVDCVICDDRGCEFCSAVSPEAA